MFSGNLKLLLSMIGILFGIVLIAKLKYLILFISWSVIIFCLGILYIKANSQNRELQDKIDYYFRKFMSSKFAKYLIKLHQKLTGKRK